jgi:hypothetical protein
MTTSQFFTKMKGYTNELAAVGRPIDEEELVEYLLAGLDDSYNSLFATIRVNNAEDMTVSELYAHISALDRCMELLGGDAGGGSSVNSASRGHGGPRGRGYHGGCHGCSGNGNCGGRHQHGGNSGNGCHGGGKTGGKDRDAIMCQICGKPGHIARKCWCCYEEEEEYEEE